MVEHDRWNRGQIDQSCIAFCQPRHERGIDLSLQAPPSSAAPVPATPHPNPVPEPQAPPRFWQSGTSRHAACPHWEYRLPRYREGHPRVASDPPARPFGCQWRARSWRATRLAHGERLQAILRETGCRCRHGCRHGRRANPKGRDTQSRRASHPREHRWSSWIADRFKKMGQRSWRKAKKASRSGMIVSRGHSSKPLCWRST